MRRRQIVAAAVAATCLALPTGVAAHNLDHAVPTPQPAAPTMSGTQMGGSGAKWEFLRSFSTNNLQSDLDFFKQGDETYASVGTFAAGGNGGQSIFRITTDGGKNIAPSLISNHPSASCAPGSGVTGLQHDVEATPKGVPQPGDILYNARDTADKAVKADTQLLIDATDAPGRCHDNGNLGQGAPNGGLEFIDISNPDQTKPGSRTRPEEIGLTSHIGESHTVNVDPKRPHIAYSVTSDSIGVTGNETRANESSGNALDGFEVVDFKSCLEAPLGTLPKGASTEEKRNQCRPQVFRFRYPSAAIALGHTLKSGIFACHETEIYVDDTLTCGSGAAAIAFDMKDAFAKDPVTGLDVPRGTPLPCSIRNSTSLNVPPGLRTGAAITDCVNGTVNGQQKSLNVSSYPEGNRSLVGVKYLGSITHTGRANARNGEVTTITSDEDIDFNHETELTDSRRFLLATDERGGGIVPPGASCAQGADNKQGNGGVHAYRVDQLRDVVKDGVPSRADAGKQYARTTKGGKAIYRAPIRTGAEETECTAHVLQQVPGQNRIFMGWYSQGTQVVDFTENADGTVDFKEAGFFIPPNANEWVSHVYKVQENPDGTFTYFGTAGDFALSNGRNSVEFYKVTLPAPPAPASRVAGPQGTDPMKPSSNPPAMQTAKPDAQQQQTACQSRAGFVSASAKGAGRSGGVDLTFRRRVSRPVTVDIFQQSQGRKVVGERLVKRFTNKSAAFRWNGRDKRGRKVPNGVYFARFRVRAPNGQADTVRVTLGKSKGRFGPRRAFFARESCGTLKTFKLSRPVFGGTRSNKLGIAYRLNQAARVQVTVTNRRERTIRRFAAKQVAANKTQRLTLSPKGLARGDYRVKLSVTQGGRTTTSTLTANRL